MKKFHHFNEQNLHKVVEGNSWLGDVKDGKIGSKNFPKNNKNFVTKKTETESESSSSAESSDEYNLKELKKVENMNQINKKNQMISKSNHIDTKKNSQNIEKENIQNNQKLKQNEQIEQHQSLTSKLSDQLQTSFYSSMYEKLFSFIGSFIAVKAVEFVQDHGAVVSNFFENSNLTKEVIKNFTGLGNLSELSFSLPVFGSVLFNETVNFLKGNNRDDAKENAFHSLEFQDVLINNKNLLNKTTTKRTPKILPSKSAMNLKSQNHMIS